MTTDSVCQSFYGEPTMIRWSRNRGDLCPNCAARGWTALVDRKTLQCDGCGYSWDAVELATSWMYR